MTRIAVVALVLVAVVSMPVTGSAQDLQDGVWTGTVSPPGGEDVDVTYEVSHEGSELAVKMVTPMGNFPFAEVRFEEGVLLFSWSPGPVLECRLDPDDDGSYYGDCVEEDDEPGQLLMVPPVADE